VGIVKELVEIWPNEVCDTWSGVELLWSGRELTTKVGNNLGLSSCTVPQSAVMCVVAYFRRTELLSGIQERSGI